ncbi:MAG: excinuclease ABC subunit UvrA [Ignavibacteria bacterium]|nr:excinuclease ABC subunit UvrA [Ignavibacteria bacterium]
MAEKKRKYGKTAKTKTAKPAKPKSVKSKSAASDNYASPGSPDSRKFIVIRGAKVHNLKNIDIDIPKYKLVVFTGVSGSGKSSLVFDTVYAEGQRRYVESLSSYARQFLEKMNKPDVDSISGLAPSMAIEQKSSSRTSRSTVGTATEIYDYLRLLFARAGDTISPVSGNIVRKDTPSSIINDISKHGKCRLYVLADVKKSDVRDFKEFVSSLRQKGFYKFILGSETVDVNDFDDKTVTKKIENHRDDIFYVVIDRMNFDPADSELVSRITDSIEMAFREGDGFINIRVFNGDKYSDLSFNKFFVLDGITFEEPEPRLFSFNNPFGACKKCQGFGRTMDIDMNLVIPDRNKSIVNNAIIPFSTPKHSKHLTDLILESDDYYTDVHKPFRQLNQKELDFVFRGGKRYIGIYKFFRMVEREAMYKLHYRVLINKYRAYTTCSECGGGRLRKEALYIQVGGKNIFDVVRMKIAEAHEFFTALKLDDYKKKISDRILAEIISRLKYLVDVGLTYLTLDRLSNTLSGGEAQRINLATSLGSSLVGSIYVLDEPSIGLHPRDNGKLIGLMKSLRDIGNSVLVVEHDRDMIKEADEIVDVGPLAGENGGEVIFQGSYEKLLKDSKSLTAKYLTGRQKVELISDKRKINKDTDFLAIKGARENNLKNIDVKIPLKMFTCITGVSGSGKSTLVNSILYGGLKKKLEGFYEDKIGNHESITGFEGIETVELIDQSQIGKSIRSNPVTYIKAFDEIRLAFASASLAKRKGFDAGAFSFNVPGGRCETCEGAGIIKVEMQFMADILLECESCGGKRYKSDTLEVRLQDNNGTSKNIYEVLETTVSEAIRFFKPYPKIVKKLKILEDVGLGYIKLGQAGTTLSGGESQRVKLAFHLANQSSSTNSLFIFDEPTTGLHYHDISKLMKCFDALLKRGNTLVVIEHNLEVIKNAEHIIDLGPDSGDGGGEIVARGTPEEIAKCPESYTGLYLKTVIDN